MLLISISFAINFERIDTYIRNTEKISQNVKEEEDERKILSTILCTRIYTRVFKYV